MGLAFALLLFAYGLAFQSLHGSLSRLSHDLSEARQHAVLADYADALVKECSGIIQCSEVAWSRQVDDYKTAFNKRAGFNLALNPEASSERDCVVRFVVWRGREAALEVCR